MSIKRCWYLVWLLFVVAGPISAAESTLVWEWDYSNGTADWQVLVVRLDQEQGVSETRRLTAMSHAACQAVVPKGSYIEGKTWCAPWPCPGAGAYMVTLQARRGERESPYSNAVELGKDAQCHTIPYDQALLTQFMSVANVSLPSTPAPSHGQPSSGVPLVPSVASRPVPPKVQYQPPPDIPPLSVPLPAPLPLDPPAQPEHTRQSVSQTTTPTWHYLCLQVYGTLMGRTKCDMP